MGNEIMQAGGFDIAPSNLQEAWDVCERLAASDLVPKDFQRKPANIMVAAQMGAELGLKPLQAIQNIAVINGRPAVWGDALLAIVRGHPECQGVREYTEGEGDRMIAICEVSRKGEEHPIRGEFSVDDAKAAGLWNKQGPWKQYPKRMLKLRARAFALRDGFADALRGIQVAEEVQDITPMAEQSAATPAPQRSSAADALLRRHQARAAVQEAEVVEPEPEDPEVDIGPFLSDIAAAETPQAIGAVTRAIKDAGLPDEARNVLREALAERKTELKAARDAEAEAAKPEPQPQPELNVPQMGDDEHEADMIARLKAASGAVAVYEVLGNAKEAFGDGSEAWLRVEAAASEAIERISS